MDERFAGKYQMLRHLAKGGMGEVMLASLRRQAGFSKLVVVKRILPHFAQDPDFVHMFVQEARLSAALDHPNIVRVYDFGRAGDSFFLVMEYLHGDTLLALLPRAVASPEGLPLDVVLMIMLGACAGLHFAHEATGADGKSLGIVHRDISPANVFVTHSGEVKVLDFGIAKAMSAGTITRAGGRKGKVPYMSPEQCLGAPIDRRSDIFALGILLYEMTTAKRLFRADSEFAVMDMITSGKVPPPSSRALGYPPALERIVLKALARDPADRHATAQELHDELEQLTVDLGLRPTAAGLGRFVRKLTGDKRYPSADELGDDDAPTLNFFASLNEIVTIGDLAIDSEVDPAPDRETRIDGPPALRPAPPPALEPTDDAAADPPPRRSRAVLALAGAAALIVAVGASQLADCTPRTPVATPTPEPPAPIAATPTPPPVTPPPPVVAATPAPTPEPAPAASKRKKPAKRSR